MTGWIPIVESEEMKFRAREAIDAITQAIVTQDYVIGRSAGQRYRTYEEALLYGYLAYSSDPASWAERAVECLNAEVDQAGRTAKYVGLFGGLAGLGWIVEHVSRILRDVSISLDDATEPGAKEEDLNSDVDAIVLRELSRFDRSACYDLISGLVGFGVYFIERWPRASAAEGIREIFTRLEDLAQTTDEGITWHSGPELLPEWQRKECPNGYYNLGVAHGIPGIIHFLSQVSKTTIVDPQRSSRLLTGAVDWLIAQQRPPGSQSRFSLWVVPGQESTDSRMTWCYGDLGILSVLLQVVPCTGRADWTQFAHDLLNHCLSWPPDQTGVTDAPLCHGAAGVAHVFNRIYQSQGDTRCRDAALTWYERALAMRQPGTGVGGFSALMMANPHAPVIWEASPAFLDGAGGIALALLAATTAVEPNWDRMFLLSTQSLD